MFSLRFVSALAATALLSMASAQSTTTNEPSSTVNTITTPSATIPVNAMTEVGCFNSSAPLEDHGAYIYRTPGNCQLVCAWLKKDVMALSDGTNCWCGDLIPANNTRISNSTCNTPCKGSDNVNCGGNKKLWVVLTRITGNDIPYYVPPADSSSSKSASAQPTQSKDMSKETTNSSTGAGSGGGANKVGIAVGAVVGVLLLLCLVAGVFFFLRHKRRREVEEEYRRQANINSFATGGKLHTSNSSMTDSRLDPEFMARRASNGSIADNEDYSRRILKVTNA